MHVSACAAGIPISCTQDTSDVGWSVLCVCVVVSLHVGRRWHCRFSANIHDPPHHKEWACRQTVGGVLRVLAVWSSWAGHWCVCSPHRTHPTSSTTLNRSTQSTTQDSCYSIQATGGVIDSRQCVSSSNRAIFPPSPSPWAACCTSCASSQLPLENNHLPS